MKTVTRTKTSLSLLVAITLAPVLSACSSVQLTNSQSIDVLIKNGQVYLGDGTGMQSLDIGLCGEKICAVLPQGQSHENFAIKRTIDATGKVVSPGFIDPHTHTIEELLSQDKNNNLNYLTQGVTTVVNGNDGEGPVSVHEMAAALEQNGIGTNVALFTGHNSIRSQVLGKVNRHANKQELQQMSQLVAQAMQDGALGLSSGLYYVPGSYANTDEVITLAKQAARYQGIYETHLRDESTFNIGFLAALEEAISISEQASLPLHLAHLKALGVDVWGQSKQAVALINAAQKRGITITADQYPWLASGTKLHSAVMPKWVMADSKQAFYQRLNDAKLSKQLNKEVTENIRRRGGPESLLITAFKDESLVGLTLADIAEQQKTSAVDAAIELVQQGDVRVASFNMSAKDVEHFMQQPWVVTSSDGTNGHPRKYASFPRKYQDYVVNKKLLTLDEFITRSSGQTAQLLNIDKRGQIKQGWQADIIIFDEANYQANADFSHWNVLSSGIENVWINGTHVIKQGEFTGTLAGKFVPKKQSL